MYCPICGRNIKEQHAPKSSPASNPVTIYYVHSYYGCDTGCCGHSITIEYENGEIDERRNFEFTHDKESMDYTVSETAHHLGIPVAWDKCEFRDNC